MTIISRIISKSILNYRHSSQSLHKWKKMSKFEAKSQIFKHFLVLDFEATCDHPKQLDPMEIIEFPVIKLNAKRHLKLKKCLIDTLNQSLIQI